jgi:tetratricopeptide (TPR) repeat protein
MESKELAAGLKASFILLALSGLITKFLLLSSCTPDHHSRENSTFPARDSAIFRTEKIDTLRGLTTAIQNNPKNSVVYFNRGVYYFEKGMYKAALNDFNKALEIHPNYAEALTKRGITRFQIQLTESSEYSFWDDLDKAISLRPDLPEAYYLRGHLKNFYDSNYPQTRGCEDICKAMSLGYPAEKNIWTEECDCAKRR